MYSYSKSCLSLVVIINLGYCQPTPAQMPGAMAVAPSSTGTVAGSTIDFKSGVLIKSVRVQLAPLEPAESAISNAIKKRTGLLSGTGTPLETLSDAEGRFLFGKVPAGQYTITAHKAGYLDTAYGSTDPFQTGSIVEVQPQQSSELTVRMLPPSTILGKIINASGDPVDTGSVNLLSTISLRGKTRHLVVGNTRPNDLGEFRFGKLPPGNYFVVFFPDHRATSSEPNLQVNIRARAIRTFHPSGTTLLEATPLHLGLGEESRGADVVVKEHTTYAIRGKMTGNPTTSAGLNLTSEDEDSMSLVISSSNLQPTGVFEFLDVSPGRYTLTYLGNVGKGSSLISTAVSVTDADVNDLSIPVLPPVHVQGQIRVDPPGVSVDLSQMTIELNAADVLIGPNFAARVSSDGTFLIENCSVGHYSLGIKMPAGTYIKSVMHNNQEQSLNSLVDIRSGNTRLELVARASESQLDGILKAEKSSVAAVYYVLVPIVKGALSSHIRVGYSDAKGRFTIKRLDPGSYRIYGFESPNLPAFENAVVRTALESIGVKVDIKENETVSVEVPLISSEEGNRIFSNDL